MELAIRKTRIESAIGPDIARSSLFSRRFPSAGWSVPSRNSGAGNGIFRCRDRRPIIHPRDRCCRQRPGTSKIGGQIPAETASFRSTTVSAVREDWMVVCAVGYEPVSLLFGQYQGDFGKKQRSGGRKLQKHLQHRHLSKIALIRYQGETGSAQVPQHRASL
jgi:hypothetical protein